MPSGGGEVAGAHSEGESEHRKGTGAEVEGGEATGGHREGAVGLVYS